MTALTQDVGPDELRGDEFEFLMKVAEVFFVGSTVLVQSSDHLAEVGTTRNGGAVCRGVCVVATTEGDATTLPTVRVRRGRFPRRNSAGDAIPATHPHGSTVWVEDDQTVSATNAGGNTQVEAGTFYGFDQNGDPIVEMGVL